MNVVSLIEYRCRETIAVLRHVLSMAIKGNVTGMAVCFRVNGKDQFAFTGDFKTDRSATMRAAGRIWWKTNQAIDAMESVF